MHKYDLQIIIRTSSELDRADMHAIAEAMHNGIINDIEARSLREAIELTHAAISVDAFDGKECLSRAPVKPERVTAT